MVKPPNALLVNPWVYDFACYDLFSKPLGLLSLASILKKNDFNVNLIDCMDRFHPMLSSVYPELSEKFTKIPCGNYYNEPVRKPYLFKSIPRIYKRFGMPPNLFLSILEDIPRPDIILVTSGMTYWYEGVFESIRILKEKFPSVPVMLGGIYVTLSFDHARSGSGADLVFQGGDMVKICGEISKLLGKKIEYNPDITFPDYELYDNLKSVTLRTSSGCPYKCLYCGWHLLNPVFRQRDPGLIVDYVEKLYRERGVMDFAFYDEALLANADSHIVIILKEIIRRNIKARFHTPNGLHARFITGPIAKLFRLANFVNIRLGFETVDEPKQKLAGGKVSTAELKNAMSILTGAGYRPDEIGVNLLIGLPGQSYEEAQRSVRFVHSLGARVHLEEYSPVPGTEYFDKTGLTIESDPLLHNNCAYLALNKDNQESLLKIKELNRTLLAGAGKSGKVCTCC